MLQLSAGLMGHLAFFVTLLFIQLEPVQPYKNVHCYVMLIAICDVIFFNLFLVHRQPGDDQLSTCNSALTIFLKIMAVFTLEDEQIDWTDKSSQTDKSSDVKTGRTNFQTTLPSEFFCLFVRL